MLNYNHTPEEEEAYAFFIELPIMFLNLSLNQRILISTSSSLRLGFLLYLAISCTSLFYLVNSLTLTKL